MGTVESELTHEGLAQTRMSVPTSCVVYVAQGRATSISVVPSAGNSELVESVFAPTYFAGAMPTAA